MPNNEVAAVDRTVESIRFSPSTVIGLWGKTKVARGSGQLGSWLR